MKSKFLAGLIATLVAIIVVVGLSLFLALVIEIEPTKNWFTVTAAVLTVGTWAGVYKWLKPETPPKVDEFGNVVEPKIDQIDNSTFKKAYLRNSKVATRTGLFLALIFLPGAICVILFADDLSDGLNITGLILMLLFGGLGLLITIKSMKLSKSINNGTDPLMNAIETNDSDYVYWFHGMIQVYSSPVKETKNYSIAIYTVGKKKSSGFTVKNEKAYNEILAFLSVKFPNAETGYSDEVRRNMKEKYNLKGIV